ncbi:MAG: hypothetical protein ACYDEV_03345 [Acidiferrobacter sp.]
MKPTVPMVINSRRATQGTITIWQAVMAASNVKEVALANVALLEDVVAFKQRFYRRGWANYDLAKPGTLKLVPAGHVVPTLEKDYARMRTMIYGHYPSFDEIMETLGALEKEINERPHKQDG